MCSVGWLRTGLLVSAVFAASVAKMTSMLSIGSGIFVRNFWIRIGDRGASEEWQVAVGRIFTPVYGLMWIGVAFAFTTVKSFSLFDKLLLAAASVQIPTTHCGHYRHPVLVCAAWFFGAMMFYRKSGRRYVEQVDLFFRNMHRPIDRRSPRTDMPATAGST